MAIGLLALTVTMGVGIFGAIMGIWLPRIEGTHGPRKSIAVVSPAPCLSVVPLPSCRDSWHEENSVLHRLT
jgi:hypothetical protein